MHPLEVLVSLSVFDLYGNRITLSIFCLVLPCAGQWEGRAEFDRITSGCGVGTLTQSEVSYGSPEKGSSQSYWGKERLLRGAAIRDEPRPGSGALQCTLIIPPHNTPQGRVISMIPDLQMRKLKPREASGVG